LTDQRYSKRALCPLAKRSTPRVVFEEVEKIDQNADKECFGSQCRKLLSTGMSVSKKKTTCKTFANDAFLRFSFKGD